MDQNHVNITIKIKLNQHPLTNVQIYSLTFLQLFTVLTLLVNILIFCCICCCWSSKVCNTSLMTGAGWWMVKNSWYFVVCTLLHKVYYVTVLLSDGVGRMQGFKYWIVGVYVDVFLTNKLSLQTVQMIPSFLCLNYILYSVLFPGG